MMANEMLGLEWLIVLILISDDWKYSLVLLPV